MIITVIMIAVEAILNQMEQIIIKLREIRNRRGSSSSSNLVKDQNQLSSIEI